MSFSWRPLLLLGALAACGPNPPAPVAVMALDVLDNGTYGPTQVALETIQNVTALKGTAAILIGGAQIVIDANDPLLTTGGTPSDDQLKEIFLKQKGADVRVNYTLRGGVLWPVDFHSWNMVTLYYNFERAFDYFDNLNILDPAEFSNSNVYYFPDFTLAAQSISPQHDNALFYSPINGFVILPFDKLQGVPLAMNRGVIAHEFSHRVFNKRVYHGQSFPSPFVFWSDGASSSFTPAFKIFKALDEGFADYHAAESLCLDPTDSECNDTKYLEPSLGAEVATARDLNTENRCLTTGLLSRLGAQVSSDPFLDNGDQYAVGTVIASSFYIPAKRLGLRGAMDVALVRAYSDLDPLKPGLAQLVDDNLSTPEGVTLGKAVGAIVSHITQPNLQEAVCSQLLDRLRLTPADLPDCPPSAQDQDICPPLQ